MSNNTHNTSQSPRTLNRRALLGGGVAMLTAAAAGRGKAAVQTQSGRGVGRGGANLSWKIAIGGESAVVRRFSFHKEPDFLGVIKLLRETDLTYAHLEMNLANLDELQWTNNAVHGGSYMVGPGYMANELKWAGVDVVSCAQNHTFDWGAPGVLATIKHLKEAGVAHAGTGFDLEQARQPVFVDKENGRVALVSCASGNGGGDWATLPKGGVPGRPGINPQRFDMRYLVDAAGAEQLKALFGKIGVLQGGRGGRGPTNQFGMAASDPTSRGAVFEISDRYGIETKCNQFDLEANLRSIDEASQLSDLVLVAHHNSASEGGRGDKPSKFAVEFAHAAVDAGADVVIGHGWHMTLGIEVYKGKPIIYGVGDLFYGSEFIDIISYDNYASSNDMNKMTMLTPAAPGLHASSGAEQGPGLETWWAANILMLHIDQKKLVGIDLHPVEMGIDLSGEKPVKTRYVGPHQIMDGTPFLAHGATARKILERVQRLSAQYGTKIEIDGEVGHLKL
jgi:poly-gamma-glutamate capsule biosynthesis protein CapA/YwtB (metallophosphatase superfamily)